MVSVLQDTSTESASLAGALQLYPRVSAHVSAQRDLHGVGRLRCGIHNVTPEATMLGVYTVSKTRALHWGGGSIKMNKRALKWKLE